MREQEGRDHEMMMLATWSRHKIVRGYRNGKKREKERKRRNEEREKQVDEGGKAPKRKSEKEKEKVSQERMRSVR